ncbi:beta-glucosidase 11-like [Dorcoceras hygrometricum]|uniref:Beta-glucosidase 11-like n=1 Tax=Dorcoceras hygrometricum TaxID=472368 RepID=A0A2Z7AE27_9LAMI|nr:beta-glucosidase 11-like [Dorcoceras hygrometricum]
MRKLLLDLGMKQEGATEIHSDSSSAIAMTKNPVFHGRAKHIEIKHHFIRELVAKKEISLKFCRTDDQIADIFTKALSYSRFSYLRSKLGMGEFESRGGVTNVIQTPQTAKLPQQLGLPKQLNSPNG